MSRKSRRTNKRSRRYSQRVQREKNYFSTPERVLNPIYEDIYGTKIYDRRRFHPKKSDQYHLQRDGKIARTTYNQNYIDKVKGIFKPPQPHFIDSMRSIVCIRRLNRKRVLFALNKIGRGRGGSQKPRRYTEDSKIVCKRR